MHLDFVASFIVVNGVLIFFTFLALKFFVWLSPKPARPPTVPRPVTAIVAAATLPTREAVRKAPHLSARQTTSERRLLQYKNGDREAVETVTVREFYRSFDDYE